MQKYIPFYTHIWSDKGFKKLSSDARQLFIYMFTNESITLCGIYEFDLDVCKLRVNLNGDFDEIFQEVVSSKMIGWDQEKEIIWVINRFKLLPNKSAKVIAGVIDEIKKIKHQFTEDFKKKYKEDLEPFMFRMPGHKYEVEDLLHPDQLNYLSKIYNSKDSLKGFLMNKGISEFKLFHLF